MRAWSTRTWRQQVRSSFDGERSGYTWIMVCVHLFWGHSTDVDVAFCRRAKCNFNVFT